MKNIKYNFMSELGKILNAGQSRTIALTGNLFDWFFLEEEEKYNPLISFLISKWGTPNLRKKYCLIVYELNGSILFLSDEDKKEIEKAWNNLHQITTENEKAIRKIAFPKQEEEQNEITFDKALKNASGNSAFALEFLRQLCIASRKHIEERNLIILVEGADMILPQGEISRLSELDRMKVSICRDWFCDTDFMNGEDSIILLTESRARINSEVSRLPQILEVKIPYPDIEERLHFISFFNTHLPEDKKPKLWSTQQELGLLTAGLSVLEIMQLLKASSYSGETLQPKDIISKIEEFIKSQLGEDIVEFKKPEHNLKDVIGNEKLKLFLQEWFIPRIKKSSISGGCVGGAIGAGKSFIFEAVAGMLGIPVIVLKNLRSKWFGETDEIFERLRRFITAIGQVLIFVDEADTQFGGVSQDVHETERRLTGKVQAMMADPKLRGRVIWLLLTARIDALSQDILRKGRAGDIIFAITDPKGQDLKEFIKWTVKPVLSDTDKRNNIDNFACSLIHLTEGYSAADFTSLREDLKAESDSSETKTLSMEKIQEIIKFRIPQDTVDFRRMQELNALIKVTDTRLLPDDLAFQNVSQQKNEWKKELKELERKQRGF